MLHIFILEVVTFPARLQVNTQSMIFFNLRLTFGQELWLGEISATCNDLKKIFFKQCSQNSSHMQLFSSDV